MKGGRTHKRPEPAGRMTAGTALVWSLHVGPGEVLRRDRPGRVRRGPHGPASPPVGVRGRARNVRRPARLARPGCAGAHDVSDRGPRSPTTSSPCALRTCRRCGCPPPASPVPRCWCRCGRAPPRASTRARRPRPGRPRSCRANARDAIAWSAWPTRPAGGPGSARGTWPTVTPIRSWCFSEESLADLNQRMARPAADESLPAQCRPHRRCAVHRRHAGYLQGRCGRVLRHHPVHPLSDSDDRSAHGRARQGAATHAGDVSPAAGRHRLRRNFDRSGTAWSGSATASNRWSRCRAGLQSRLEAELKLRPTNRRVLSARPCP